MITGRQRHYINFTVIGVGQNNIVNKMLKFFWLRFLNEILRGSKFF